MKKGRFRNLFPLALVLVMVFTVVGCSSNNKENAAPSPTSSGNEVSSQPTESAEPSKEDITITVWPVTFAQNFPSGVQQDPVAKDIYEKTKVKIDVESHPTDEKFQAMLASGDLSDVIIPENTTQYVKQLIEGDNLVDLEPYLAQYAPDILKNAADAIEYSKKYQSNGTGKLYFIPSSIVNKPSPKIENKAIVGPFLRWDYYQDIGAPELKGYDDFLNAVKAMLDKHPTNESGQKFYGFSQWFDWDIWGIAMFPSFMEGKDYFANGLYQVDHATAEMESMLTAERSSMWLGVDFWNKAYKMGLLDPDALTQKYDTAIQKGSSNRVLAAIASWQLRDSNALLNKAGMPDKGYTPVPVPVTGGKNIYSNVGPFGSNRYWAVSKNAKSPERAVELINYFYTVENAETLYNGIKGVDWTEEGGKRKQSAAFLEGMKADPNYVLTSGAGKYNNIIGLNKEFINPNTNETLLIQSREALLESLIPVDKAMTEHYKVELPVDILPPDQKPYFDNYSYIAPFMPIAPDDIKRIDDKIINYVQSALAKMILTKDEAKYNAMKEEIISKVRAMDYDTSFNWYQTAFKEAKEKGEPFMK
ncbi:type 2 periplasmic-binding domain-containing protein [Cohnella abietis]|uniref:ABC transporter substrate-binding protein n=1 Tax=Cohnella abietis TaxID=2507935 RepID=A0A3T1DF30_9BACL|nr:hypothetical protein [Cohnella abietis]BBI36495.1 hypothetical protein KCTCHS21_58940 [Cohnella abietis]